jgi:serine/threonine protein kinase/Tol biopolymer transport system component
MKPERWRQITEIFHAALACDEAERAAFVGAQCGEDGALRREVEAMIAAHQNASQFGDNPVYAQAPMLEAGSVIGPYRIDHCVGAGGMGVVYRAQDTKLNRPVAIKFLSEDLADATARRRFQREAQMASSLNHPHILTVHDVGEFEDRQYLVTEFVDGGTLDDWAREQRTWRQVAGLLTGVADGLAAAHGAGILHRDIKPANILVASNGYAKLADFGLAKLAEGAESDPTRMTQWRTGAHMIIGTLPYMSPEQASGKRIDARSDIFSFGVVLYEMLARRKPFEGATSLEVMEAIIHREPEALPASLPLELGMVVEKALEKDPADRYQSTRDLVVDLRRLVRHTRRGRDIRDISDARVGIEEASSDIGREGATIRGKPKMWRWLPWAAVVVFAIAAGLAVWSGLRYFPASEVRFEISTPPTTDPVSIAVSNDGQQIVFVATFEGQPRLWLRSLDSAVPRPLSGTENAMFPFWSPDNRSIGFFADYKLKRIDTVSGAVETLAPAHAGRGGSWNADGVIVYAPGASAAIFRIPATGGEPVAVTRFKPGQQWSHRFPRFLADGQHFTFYAQGSPETKGLYAGRIDGSEPVRLSDDIDDTYGNEVYLPSGHLLFLRQRALYAQTFDARRLTLIGSPVPVAAAPSDRQPILALAGSSTGLIAYRTISTGGNQLTWLDRSGQTIEKVGGPNLGVDPALLPDGRFLAMRINNNGNNDIGVLDTKRNAIERLTFDPAIDGFPVWSPDGSRLAFSSSRNGGYKLYWKSINGGAEELLLDVPNGSPLDWSSDGRLLLYQSVRPKTGADLWVLPLDGRREPFAVAQTSYQEQLGQFSPDAKWIAYQSDKSGRDEIYVQALAGPGGKPTAERRISIDGGAQVRWRRDGKELFYIAPGNRLMAVPIQFGSQGQTVEAGTPVPLFTARLSGKWQTAFGYQYVPSADGQRLLMNIPAEEGLSPITIIMNWRPKS